MLVAITDIRKVGAASAGYHLMTLDTVEVAIRGRQRAGVPVLEINGHFTSASLGTSTARFGAAIPVTPFTDGAVDWAITMVAVDNLGRRTTCAATMLRLGELTGLGVGTSTTTYTACSCARIMRPVTFDTINRTRLSVALAAVFTCGAQGTTEGRLGKRANASLRTSSTARLRAGAPLLPSTNNAIDRARMSVAALNRVGTGASDTTETRLCQRASASLGAATTSESAFSIRTPFTDHAVHGAIERIAVALGNLDIVAQRSAVR